MDRKYMERKQDLYITGIPEVNIKRENESL